MMLPRTATGWYLSRISVISAFVRWLSATRSEMMPDMFLEFASAVMRASSSRMLPLLSLSILRILSSMSFSCF